MTDRHTQALTAGELESTRGGSWEDFHSGFTYSLSVGCFLSVNPFVCGAALVSHGIGIWVF